MVEIFDSTKIYNVPEAAGILRINQSTLRGYVSQGSISHLKYGSGKSNVRFSGEMLNDWVKSKTVLKKIKNPANGFQVLEAVGNDRSKKKSKSFDSFIKDIKGQKKKDQ